MLSLATGNFLSSPYQGYAYSYPHKTAYRHLSDSIPLSELWQREDRSSLFLYVHVPFCEMRCAFCNLFTQPMPKGNLVQQYLDTLERQTTQIQDILSDAQFARFAIGGGTPTFLSIPELERLFDLVENCFSVNLHEIPISVEASPGTIDTEKLGLLRQRGVTRLSMGIQSFLEEETKLIARRQPVGQLEDALKLLSDCGIPTINLDLIYGLPEQTEATWVYSLHRTLEQEPEEIYLYPLYVRELTGLGRSQRQWDDQRLHFYRVGRDLLLESGYEQISMRMFRAKQASEEGGPVYCCQTDGMVGLGCGARSYTQSLHYSSEYAVGASGVREILQHYLQTPTESFRRAEFGFQLNDEEQQRRFVIQSLLQVEGLSLPQYQSRFGSEVLHHLPQLHDLLEQQLAKIDTHRLQLTPDGLALSDAIGPWLYSAEVTRLMEEYEQR